ncbi:Crp/Fnr family transcriptional regulator [Flavobacterium anhuiense]|uniref:Crp/Fnr family transcriptional regulator n=1 Tax=Flavobacterium anhuiense TaxID=459526 RepID=UPI000E6BF3E5|nr:Crp/Fnr family transcriptional regulator [Flavobacterium anhuiense]
MADMALRKNIELNITLTDPEWCCILEKANYTIVKKNEFLQTQNSNTTYEIFIVKGSFKIYILNEDGTESIVFFAFENNWMCDIESFYHQKASKYNIKAMQHSEVWIISRPNKMLLLKQVPKLIYFQIRMLEQLNLAIEKRLLDILHKTSKQRYSEFVKRYPDKIKNITDRNLSLYLGVSHEFLSKIKKM